MSNRMARLDELRRWRNKLEDSNSIASTVDNNFMAGILLALLDATLELNETIKDAALHKAM